MVTALRQSIAVTLAVIFIGLLRGYEHGITLSKVGSKFTLLLPSTNTTGAAMASFKLIPNQRWFIMDWKGRERERFDEALCIPFWVEKERWDTWIKTHQGHGGRDHATPWSPNYKGLFPRAGAQYSWSHWRGRLFTCEKLDIIIYTDITHRLI